MRNSYPTPHIKATPDDVAKTVLMPGDPLRSEFIAENFLTDPVLFNDVRGVRGYTGTYKGHRVSVMASGMGIPSMGIYSYELYNFFGVENIIRIGSAGSIRKNINLRDVIVGMGVCTDSNYAKQFGLPGDFAPIADYSLLTAAVKNCEKLGIDCKVGNVLSSDHFYTDSPDYNQRWAKMGVMAVEMETAGLYMNAARSGRRALAIYTVTDNIVTGESLDAEARRSSLVDMIKVALETAVDFDK